MDQAQNRALAALQPFLHLAISAKSPSPRMLADLITRATSAQGTYTFAELLHTSAIQSLRSEDQPEEFRSYLTVLEIFSYGTLVEYKSTPNLPPLSSPQQHKLSLLTLLSIASEPHPLTYSYLISTLSLPSDSALESLVTEAIYNGLITARLSPTSTPPTVHMTSVAPLRDVRPDTLPEILKVLRVWESRCAGVVGDVEAQIANIKQNAVKRKQREQRRQDAVENAVLNLDGWGHNDDLISGDKASRLVGKRGASSKENKKNRGIGNKRDLDEQQEDEVSQRWGPPQEGQEAGGCGGGGSGRKDGGTVESGLARMEVDEGPGSPGKSGEDGRTAKRAVGKKRA